ncbi:unnamed protein product [Chrysoparadoxa australica]
MKVSPLPVFFGFLVGGISRASSKPTSSQAQPSAAPPPSGGNYKEQNDGPDVASENDNTSEGWASEGPYFQSEFVFDHEAWTGHEQSSANVTSQDGREPGERPEKDLKKLLQDLEDSEYGGYGNWGSLGSRQGSDSSTSSGPKWGKPLRPPASERRNGAYYEGQQEDQQQRQRQRQKPPSTQWVPPDSQQQLDSEVGTEEGLEPGMVPIKTSPAQLVTPISSLDMDYSSKVMDYAGEVVRSKALSFASCLRIFSVAALGSLGAYTAVSPRNLPRELYMGLYKRNMLLFATSLLGPLTFAVLVYDAQKANLGMFVQIFTYAFTWGFVITVVAELVLATAYKMAVLFFMERAAYDLCPAVPAIYLPWVLRDHGYRPSPISSFVSDFAVYCLGAPFIEEYMKVWIVRRLGALQQRPKGGNVAMRKPTHVHTYLMYVVGASLGLKAADNARRVFMYTHASHDNKFIFAAARGFFPLHELGAGLTAMNLARREILGENVPMWKVYFPAALLHAWANFRGKKPMFKWKADAPWNELMLQAFVIPKNASVTQLVHRGIATVVWVSILLKVLAFTIKTYWRLHRLHNSQLRQHFMRHTAEP